MELMHSVVTSLRFELVRLEGTPVTVWTTIELIVLTGLLIYLSPKINSFVVKRLSNKISIPDNIRSIAIKISRLIVLLIGFTIIVHFVGLDAWCFKQLHNLYLSVQEVMDLKLFKIGHTQLTLWTAIYLVIISLFLVRGTAYLHDLIVDHLLARTHIDTELKHTVGSLVHYAVLSLGLIVLLQSAGIDLSTLTVVLGALGIGISFGLQTITNNFISGLIILFERPIKIGDRIQIGDVVGEIINISLRATTVMTNQNIVIVVPNSQFITGNVINLTYSGHKIGLNFPVVVPAKYDPQEVQKMLLDVVKNNQGILKSPEPIVLFEEFSNDQLKFSLSVWTTDYLAFPDRLRSDLNFAISKKFKGLGIEAQIPQGANYFPPAQAVSTQ